MADPLTERPQPAHTLDSLRALIAQVEQRPAPKLARPVTEQVAARPPLLPFEIGDVDAALQGGLAYDCLQEVLPARTEWDDGLTTAFCASLLIRRRQEEQCDQPTRNEPAPLFWIAQHDTAGSGLSAQGLVSLGLDPHALWLVQVRNDSEALWAFEEVLDHPDALGVVCELCQLDLAQSHRLNLKAAETAREDRGRLLLALRRHKGARRPQANPTAAATRWRLASIPPHLLASNGHGQTRVAPDQLSRRPAPDAAALSLGPRDGPEHQNTESGQDSTSRPPSPPPLLRPLNRVRWRAEMFRQRGGAPASWLLEWSYETHGFRRLSELCTVGTAAPD